MFMKRVNIILFVTFFSIVYLVFIYNKTCYGKQINPDSLNKIILNSEGIVKLQAMEALINELSDHDPNQAAELATEAIKLSEKLGDQEIKLTIMWRLGTIYLRSEELSKALPVINSSIEYASRVGNRKFELLNQIELSEYFILRHEFDSATNLINKLKLDLTRFNLLHQLPALYIKEGVIAQNNGDRLKAIGLYIKAANIYEQNNNFDKLAVVHNNIAILHLSMHNRLLAIDYFKRAIKVNKEQNKLINLNNNYNNIGTTYQEIDSLHKAMEYFIKSIELSRKLNNESYLARVYMNMGNVLVKEQMLEDAKISFDSSIYYCKKNNIAYGILLNKICLGRIYIVEKDYDKAISTFLWCENEIKNFDNPENLSKLYHLLSDAYEKDNQIKKAFYYYRKHIEINEEIASLQTNKTILELQAKYDQERSEKEIVILQQKVLEAKALKQFYIIAFLIATISFLLIGLRYFIHRRKVAYNHKIENQEKEYMQLEVKKKEQEIVNKALQVARMNEVIVEVNLQMKTIMPELSKENAKKLFKIEKYLENGLAIKAREEFETSFELVHKDFFQQIMSQFPELSPTELKTCSFLRLGLSSKDIAEITNRSIRTIENTRNNIRKKLNLTTNSNLTTFLLSIT